MRTLTFRNYVEQRTRGDAEFREFARSFDDELLDAQSWRQSWDVLRERGLDMSFVMSVRKVWDDYNDVLSTLDRKRAEADRRP